MNHLRELIGQPIALRLLEQYARGTPPPLLIFAGPQGTGKWSAAEAFVQLKLCEVGTACGTCSACRKFRAGDHADYIRFPAGRVGIGDPERPEEFTVRWLIKTRIIYAPFDGAVRFVLFPAAQLLQHEAETALLKTLEEPPAHTRFIFVTPSLAALKPTVISRGVVIPFQHLPLEALRKFQLNIPPENLELLGGSLQPVPLFYSELYRVMDGKIADGLSHPLSLLDLEHWLQGGERTSFKSLSGEEEFTFPEILDFFSLLLLRHCGRRPRRQVLSRLIFEFKKELARDRPGMTPYLLARLFYGLDRVLFPG